MINLLKNQFLGVVGIHTGGLKVNLKVRKRDSGVFSCTNLSNLSVLFLSV